ncbi:MAG: hypothetical protein WCD80_04475 [Desulfobaccales bacterium]
MLIPCLKAEARFADPGLRLGRATPAPMVWDEHGGTFVLRVEDLEVAEVSPPEPESRLSLTISLTPPEQLSRALEEFAARHQLPLPPPSAPELAETAILAACHLPGRNLFIFAEAPGLVVRTHGATLEVAVSGDFKARRVPCQATDLVIHLDKAVMARLVAFVLSQARDGV